MLKLWTHSQSPDIPLNLCIFTGVITRILTKIKAKKAECILVVPYWLDQA